MMTATHPVSKKIAIAFDFDDTLVPNAYDVLLESLGFDAARYRRERYEPLKAAGWDGIPARFYDLVQVSKGQTEGNVTQASLAELGRSLQPFAGVAELFDRLRECASAIDPEIQVEFYLVTSGFLEVARHTAIAHQFSAMWGCEFHYGEAGEIQCLKRSLSYPEKPRYLYSISKGVSAGKTPDLLFAYDDLAPEEIAIPMTQMIYVGDGTSDIPCFAMLNKEGGIPIGVNQKGTPQAWADHYQPSEGQRVMTLAPPDYRESSDLFQTLKLAVEGISKRIKLMQSSR